VLPSISAYEDGLRDAQDELEQRSLLHYAFCIVPLPQFGAQPGQQMGTGAQRVQFSNIAHDGARSVQLQRARAHSLGQESRSRSYAEEILERYSADRDTDGLQYSLQQPEPGPSASVSQSGYQVILSLTFTGTEPFCLDVIES
jgi:hypothetical protein